MARFNKFEMPPSWQHYWTKYPEGYTMVEALLNWIEQTNQLTTNVNKWNDYLDGFVQTFDIKLQPTVRAIIDELDASGRLGELINGEVFDRKADKTALDALKLLTDQRQAERDMLGTTFIRRNV